jgi:hypothetical protein
MIGKPHQSDPRTGSFDCDLDRYVKTGEDPRWLFAHDETASMPVKWKRKSQTFMRLRRHEYAYIAHRWPEKWAAQLCLARESRTTEAEAHTLIGILAEHFGVLDWTLEFKDKWFRADARPMQNNMRLPSEGYRLTVGVVLHEFAHWLAGPDIKSGHNGNWSTDGFERWNPRYGGYVWVSGKSNTDHFHHGPSFIYSMIEIYKVAGGLTHAF